MKIMLLATCLLAIGCFKKSINISGTYITEWSNEFAEVRDTIQIAFDHTGACNVTRRMYVMKNHKPEYKLVHWAGDYNVDAQTLVIRSNARILYFKEDEMRMGTTIYKKL
jgi:hypothetical protein